jgi:hypothetical protein
MAIAHLFQNKFCYSGIEQNGNRDKYFPLCAINWQSIVAIFVKFEATENKRHVGIETLCTKRVANN